MNKLLYIITIIITVLMQSGCNPVKETTEEEHHEEENIISFTPTQYKNAGIAFGKIENRQLSSTIQVNGLLDVPPQNLLTVSAMMGGFVKTTVLLQGMRVKKGQELLTIQNPDFIQIQQDYLDTKSKLKFAELEYRRQEELAKDNVTSQKLFQQATADYQSLKAKYEGLLEKLSILGINPSTVENGTIKSTVSIKSPINGFVTAVNINLGKYVNPQDIICEIVDTEHLHAELTVFEKDLFKIKEGQKVRFRLVNDDDKERTATIFLINRKIAEDRTVRVHAHMDKEDHNLIPNTYLKASIEVKDNTTTALPEEAVVASEKTYYIFIKDLKGGHVRKEAAPAEEKEKEEGSMDKKESNHKEEENKSVENNFFFKAIEIKKGVSENGYTEVILPPNFDIANTEVVIKGAYALLSKMNNSEGEGHAH